MGGIINGIISGVVVIVVAWLARHLWVTKIEPWCEDKVYKDIEIKGQWNITSIEVPERKERITLHRKGRSITGEISCTGGPDDGKLYDFEGSFYNGILTGTYTARNKSALDRGTYTLMLTKNGTEFHGSAAYYDDEASEIMEGKTTWTKASDVHTS
jgi:hypothetical protein